jgi:hypothetical protein
LVPVGIGLPGFVDSRHGIVHGLSNVAGWDEVPVSAILSERLNVPVILENDANAMAYGMMAAEPGIDTVTPAVISRVKGRSPGLRLRVSTPICGGHKLVARRGSSAQEVFVVTTWSKDQLQQQLDQWLGPEG